MPKMIVSIDGVVIKEVQLTKDRTTLGRRPYNDIVIDNLAVSGEHAVLQLTGNDVYLEDLNSTNGTYVNGKAVKKQLCRPVWHATPVWSTSSRMASPSQSMRISLTTWTWPDSSPLRHSFWRERDQ